MRIWIICVMLLVAGCSTTPSEEQDDFSADSEASMQLGKGDLPPGYNPPKSIKQALKRGDAAYVGGDAERAMFEYTQGLELEGNKADLYFRIGRIQFEREQYGLAAVAFEKTLEENDKFIAAHEQWGLALLRSKQYEPAREHFQQAISLDDERRRSALEETSEKEPSSRVVTPPLDRRSPYWAYAGLGLLADLKQDFASAQTFFKQAISVNPQLPQGYNNLGYSCYLAGDWGCADTQWRKAISLQSDNETAWRNLGMLQVRKRDLKGAFKSFMKIEKNYEAYNDIGYVLMLMGEAAQAKKYLNKSIETAPFYYKPAYENLSLLELDE